MYKQSLAPASARDLMRNLCRLRARVFGFSFFRLFFGVFIRARVDDFAIVIHNFARSDGVGHVIC